MPSHEGRRAVDGLMPTASQYLPAAGLPAYQPFRASAHPTTPQAAPCVPGPSTPHSWPGCPGGASRGSSAPGASSAHPRCLGAPAHVRAAAGAGTGGHGTRTLAAHVNSQKGGGTCSPVPASASPSRRAGGGSRIHPLGAHRHVQAHPSASPKPGRAAPILLCCA